MSKGRASKARVAWRVLCVILVLAWVTWFYLRVFGVVPFPGGPDKHHDREVAFWIVSTLLTAFACVGAIDD